MYGGSGLDSGPSDYKQGRRYEFEVGGGVNALEGRVIQ